MFWKTRTDTWWMANQLLGSHWIKVHPGGGGKPNFIIVFVLSPTGKCELSYFELLGT